jgi:hypothetical protein
MQCDRCKRTTPVHSTSWFNTDTLCPECKAAERQHPDFARAQEAEIEACKRGDYNFPGVGWPGEHGRLHDRALKTTAIISLVIGAAYWYATLFIDTAFAVGAL